MLVEQIEIYGGNEMKCPFCDTEMLQGYLNCGLVIWSTRKHKLSLLSSSYCPKCKRMIIDCAEYESNI